MKKFVLDSLSLDQETFALLDEKQLNEVVGGLVCPDYPGAATTGCAPGGSTCSGKTTGCAGGDSTCG